jgi:Flp pilus assembly protein CpaB
MSDRAGVGTAWRAPQRSALEGPLGPGDPSDDGARAPPSVLRRRRPLPSGRALTGALLLAVAVVAIVAAYADATAGPTDSYVVAGRDLDAGARLRRDDLSLVAADLPAGVRRQAFTDPADLVGARLLGPLAAGELVQAAGLVADGGGEGRRHELSFPVERAHALDGRLARGEQVDVLATYGTGIEARTVVVVRGGLVVGVGHDRDGLGDDGTVVLTLALDRPDDVVALTHAVQAGRLTVVRSTGGAAPSGSDSYQPPTDEAGG